MFAIGCWDQDNCPHQRCMAERQRKVHNVAEMVFCCCSDHMCNQEVETPIIFETASNKSVTGKLILKRYRDINAGYKSLLCF